MSDDNLDADADALAADGDGEPLAGNDGAQGGSGDTSLSSEDARKLRSESRSLRQRLKDAEAKLTEREAADLSEQQKLERDLTAASATRDQLEAENRTLRAQSLAAKVGIRADAVDLAVAALDWTEISDPTDTKEIERALKELVKDRPFLSSRPDGLDGGRGRGQGNGGNDINDMIRAAVRRT